MTGDCQARFREKGGVKLPSTYSTSASVASIVVELEGRIPADFEYWKPTFKSEATVELRFALPASTALIAETFFASTVTDGARLASTLNEQVAFIPPSAAVAVMVALPALTPVTLPLASTVATASLLEDQETDLLSALDGVTVATSVIYSPSLMVAELRSREIPVTWTILSPPFPDWLLSAPFSSGVQANKSARAVRTSKYFLI